MCSLGQESGDEAECLLVRHIVSSNGFIQGCIHKGTSRSDSRLLDRQTKAEGIIEFDLKLLEV